MQGQNPFFSFPTNIWFCCKCEQCQMICTSCCCLVMKAPTGPLSIYHWHYNVIHTNGVKSDPSSEKSLFLHTSEEETLYSEAAIKKKKREREYTTSVVSLRYFPFLVMHPFLTLITTIKVNQSSSHKQTQLWAHTHTNVSGTISYFQVM